MSEGDIMYLIVTCTAGSAGQTGEATFKTGVNYITASTGISKSHATDERCDILSFIKSGSNFLVSTFGSGLTPR